MCSWAARGRLGACALAVVLAACGQAMAQDGGLPAVAGLEGGEGALGAAGADSTGLSEVHLGPVHQDFGFFFSIRPISSNSEAQREAGREDFVALDLTQEWNYLTPDRAGLTLNPMTRVRLAQWHWPERGWTLSVEQAQVEQVVDRAVTALDVLGDFAAQMNSPDSAVRLQERTFLGQPGGTLELFYRFNGVAMRRMTAAVMVEPRRFFLITLDSLAASSEQAPALLEQVVGSFASQETPVTRRLVRDALVAGRDALAELRRPERRLDTLLDSEESWFVIQAPRGREGPSGASAAGGTAGGRSAAAAGVMQPVGYLRLRESWNMSPDVDVRISLRQRRNTMGAIFEEAGRVFEGKDQRVDLFSMAFFGATEDTARYRDLATTTFPRKAPGGEPLLGPDRLPLMERVVVSLDLLRVERELVSTRRDDTQAVSGAPYQISLPRGAPFLDQAAERLLPRVLDLGSKTRLYAWYSYAPQRGGLTLRTLTIGQPQLLSTPTGNVACHVLDWREGLDGPALRVWVDGRGRMVRSEAQGRVLVRTPKAEIERMFAEQSQQQRPVSPRRRRP